MNEAINLILVLGFLILDWFRFHDIFKPEMPTAADWVTGVLSILVFYVAVKSMLATSRADKAAR